MDAYLTDNGTVQRSEEWLNARLGKFSASEIYKLMGVRGLGETGKSYAMDKAIEELYGKMEENFVSYDMDRGITLEPLAFNKFKELKEADFLEVENCSSYVFGDHAIATPDGLVSDNSIVEIKAPRSTTFFDVVATNEVDKKYFYQIQMQLMATGKEKGYFFNYMVFDGQEFWHEIKVEKCEKTIELMKQRINEAVEIKLDYINKIQANKQF